MKAKKAKTIDLLKILQEKKTEFSAISALIAAAFAKVGYSDQSEHKLVARLRNDPAYVPELALVAYLSEQLVGHILLSKIEIKSSGDSIEGLALAPVSVHPNFQRLGIGSALIKQAHKIAQDLGFKFIVLIGHEDYYLDLATLKPINTV